MRATAPLFLSALLPSCFALSGDHSPFTDPLHKSNVHPPLVKRQSCPSGYNVCSSLGASDVCCPSDTTCALDQANHVACCPLGAVCTGTIGGTLTGSATTSGFVLGGTTTLSTTTSTTNFATPSLTLTGSTVPNQFFPFVYIPTTYANAALCTSAYSNCQAESTACFNSLAGVNGVTISGLGGGITQVGNTGTILSSASSICSSLSMQACYGLQTTQCSAFPSATGVGGATVTVTASDSAFVQAAAAGPRQAACPGMVYAAGAGAMMGAIIALV